jgi:hypothetical protein
MKTVGKRIPAKGIEASAAFLQLVVDLRGNKPFVPKGVYRYKTFEEAQKAMFDFVTRRPENSADSQKK